MADHFSRRAEIQAAPLTIPPIKNYRPTTPLHVELARQYRGYRSADSGSHLASLYDKPAQDTARQMNSTIIPDERTIGGARIFTEEMSKFYSHPISMKQSQEEPKHLGNDYFDMPDSTVMVPRLNYMFIAAKRRMLKQKRARQVEYTGGDELLTRGRARLNLREQAEQDTPAEVSVHGVQPIEQKTGVEQKIIKRPTSRASKRYNRRKIVVATFDREPDPFLGSVIQAKVQEKKYGAVLEKREWGEDL